ncbi:MAG TPA: HD domain-containing phosphohydrolase [Anaerolineales bacterium]|nr:HD domain-containing phosphohydrolase [Anaerolineales bacterium]
MELLLNDEQRLGNPLQAFADLLFTLDGYGMVLECQFGDASISFDACEQIHHKQIQDILPSDVGDKLDHFISQARNDGRSSSFEFPLTMGERHVWFDGCLVAASDSSLILSARNITKYKQTESRMQRQLQRLSALRSIDLAIASGLDLSLLLSILLDRVIETMHVDAAAVLLLDSEMNILKFGAGKGFRTNILQHTHLKPGQGYAGRAVLERRMINIPDLTQNSTEFERSPLFPSERFVVYYGIPLVAKGRVLGVLEVFHRSHLNPDEDWLDFLNIISGQTAIAIDSAMMFKELQKSNFELSLAYNATIDAWSRTLDLRDKETEGHTRRVTDITLRFAAMSGIKDEELIHIRRGATLHDIGKVVIPDNILFKPGPLDHDEWETMRQHPGYAVDLLAPIKYLEPAMDIPHWHHEKWDGTGYPDGIGGEEIPYTARMFALADVYDALTSDRPYRHAWSKKDAVQYIKSQAGKHFDPRLVPEFLSMAADSAF